MVMQHHKPECHAEKNVHCVKKTNKTKKQPISAVSSKSAGPLASKLDFIVHKPECPVEKWDYSVHGQGHSEGSKC